VLSQPVPTTGSFARFIIIASKRFQGGSCYEEPKTAPSNRPSFA